MWLKTVFMQEEKTAWAKKILLLDIAILLTLLPQQFFEFVSNIVA